MDLVREYVPTDAEVPEDHWSKHPEYMAEKAVARAKELQKKGVEAGNHKLTTHEVTQRAFQTEYVMTEEEVKAKAEKLEAVFAPTKNTVPLTEEELTEMAKNILSKVTEELEKAESDVKAG